MGRTGWTILGAVLTLTGAVWTFQGIGVLPGSFMTGSDFWAAAGVLTAIGGALVLRAARRGRGGPPPTDPDR